MKLSEVINPIKPIGTVQPVTAKPATGTSAGTTAANVANVSPAGSTTTTSQPAPNSSGGAPENKPLSSQSIDALAQVIKSAGLNPTQISQLLSKAK